MARIRNPILPGFHPDPSIVKAGDEYFIANSTFEWFGGVEVHRSKDLVNWIFAARPLSTSKHLDMEGNPPSGGIWAPCLSYADGLFWLIFTDVKTWNAGPYKDTHNYVTTAKKIEGPWSDPVYLNSSGFDASLFHDSDGRKWYVNMEWDYRKPGKKTFSGILLQEFDAKTRSLKGPITKIYTGTPIGLVEGPHLYRRNGWYYLVVAEGGTGYEHAVTVARSRVLTGPYETHPENPLVSSDGKPGLALQKAGHGSIVETPGGQSYLVFLLGRPLPGTKNCVLGRETGIAEIIWKEDWPYIKDGDKIGGGNAPLYVEIPGVAEPATQRVDEAKTFYSFDDDGFREDLMTLRLPYDESLFSTKARKGWLRIFGKESPVSAHEQAIIARRQEHFRFSAETYLEFSPDNFQQMAGLMYRYDEANHYYLRLSWNERTGTKSLGLIVMDARKFTLPLGDDEVRVEGTGVFLRLQVDYNDAQFWYSTDGFDEKDFKRGQSSFSAIDSKDRVWHKIGPVLEAGKLSDDYDTLGFTGAFVGLCCQDMQSKKAHADFRFLSYEGQSSR